MLKGATVPEEISPTIETQPADTKSSNWPKVILAAVLGLGLLAGAAYTGYWYGTRSAKLPPGADRPLADKSQSAKPTTVTQPTPTPTSTLTPTPPVIDPTAGWNTYTNADWGISFKYKGNGPIQEGAIDNPNASSGMTRYASYVNLLETSTSEGITIHWGVKTNEENLTLEEYYDKYAYQSGDPSRHKVDKNYKIGNISAIRTDSDARPQGISSTTIHLRDSKGRVHHVLLLHYLDEDKVKIAEEIVKTIKIK